jgi:SH3-like domain-containing protein
MKKVLLFLLLLTNALTNAFAEDRFMVLRSNEVNVRVGPSQEYPIKFTYQLKDMPIKIMGEYDNWYKIIDKDGDDGWINKNLAVNRRNLIVVGGTQIMYNKKDINSKPIFRIEENVVLNLKKCDTDNWCKVEKNNKVGWIQSENVWGN